MHTRLIKKTLAVLALAGWGLASQAATVSLMDGAHDMEFGDGCEPPGCVDSGPGLFGLGHTTTKFSGDYTGAIAAGPDVLIIEQDAHSTAASVITGLTSYMTGGGRVILAGDSDADGFINALFGSSVAISFSTGTYALDAGAAAGTTFEGGPASLGSPSSSHAVSAGALPGSSEVFYSGTGGDQVFRTAVGAGDFFYIGWDFCCSGGPGTLDGYYDVLESAITFGSASPVPAPAPLGLLALGLMGVIAINRRKARQVS